MRIVTPFRPFEPETSHHESQNFDWRGAIQMLRASAFQSSRLETVAITDIDTELAEPRFRYVTDQRRLMLWILEISLRYLASDDFDQDTIMVSPDMLVRMDLRPWFPPETEWTFDLGILVRPRFKNSVLNSVQFWPIAGKPKLIELYARFLEYAQALPDKLIKWGADTVPLADLLAPLELGIVDRCGARIAMIDADVVTEGALDPKRQEFPERIIDFRYRRKLFMKRYFEAANGMKIVNGWAFPDEDVFMAAHMGKDGSYQRRNLAAALRRASGWRTALDGGAHVGTWSRVLSDAFEKVIAFEPSQDTFQCLVRNMLAFDCPNVQTRWQALGSSPGRVRMSYEGFEKAERTKNTGARFVHPGDDVERITIDSLQLADLDFLKLDVEGSEPDAIAGAVETLKRCRPLVLYEDKNLSKRFGHKRDAIPKILTELGAVRLERVSMDEIWGWKKR